MKHLTFALLAVLSFSSFGFAKTWKPYVGIGGLLEQPTVYEHKLSPSGWRPVYPSSGMRFEVGLRGPRQEWFAAYYVSNSATIPDDHAVSDYIYDGTYVLSIYTRESDQTSWGERRILLGLRRDIKIGEGAKWIPMIGGAFNLGVSKSRRHHTATIHSRFSSDQGPALMDTTVTHSYSENWTSDYFPGLTAEAGLRTKIIPALEAVLLADVHFYPAIFGQSDSFSQATRTERRNFAVFTPAVSLQVRYVIP